MADLYTYLLQKYPLLKKELYDTIHKEYLSIDDIVSTIYDISFKFFPCSNIYTEDILKNYIRNYIYNTFIYKSIYFIKEDRKKFVNKRGLIKNYMKYDGFKGDEQNFDNELNTRYRNLNRHISDIVKENNNSKLVDFQIPYIYYHIRILTNSNYKDFKKIYNSFLYNTYTELTFKSLQKFVLNFTKFIYYSEEKYKDISYYRLEKDYLYSTILFLINEIKNNNLKDNYYCLYDLSLIFSLPDINLRMKSIKLYFNSDKKDFIKDTIYLSSISFNFINYYIDIAIQNLNSIGKLESIVSNLKTNFFDSEIPNNCYKKRTICDIDEKIFYNISHLLENLNINNSMIDIINLNYEYEKDNSTFSYSYNRSLSELNEIVYTNNFDSEIEFLLKLYYYNKNMFFNH